MGVMKYLCQTFVKAREGTDPMVVRVPMAKVDLR